VVVQAMVASPLLLAVATVEMVVGRRGPDLVSPLVRRFYNQARLSVSPTPAMPKLRAVVAREPSS